MTSCQFSVCPYFIIAKPTIIKPLQDMEIFEGDHAKMSVCIEGVPKPESSWYKDDMRIIEDDSLSIEIEGNHQTLSIPDVVEEDCGIYSIIAKNEVGEAQSQASLSVVGKKKLKVVYFRVCWTELFIIPHQLAVNCKLHIIVPKSNVFLQCHL